MATDEKVLIAIAAKAAATILVMPLSCQIYEMKLMIFLASSLNCLSDLIMVSICCG